MKNTLLRLAPYPRCLLAGSVALALSACSEAWGTTFEVNEDWSLTTNTTLTLGSSWALRNADGSQVEPTVVDATTSEVASVLDLAPAAATA